MTSNAGTSELEKSGISFTTQDKANDVVLAINQIFSPEFRNRLDAIIQFDALTEKTMLSIVSKFIIELEKQLKTHHVTIDIETFSTHVVSD